MALKTLPNAFAFLAPAGSGDAGARDPALPRRGWLSRMFYSVVAARQRQAERYVAEYMARRGLVHRALQDELREQPATTGSRGTSGPDR